MPRALPRSPHLYADRRAAKQHRFDWVPGVGESGDLEVEVVDAGDVVVAGRPEEDHTTSRIRPRAAPAGEVPYRRTRWIVRVHVHVAPIPICHAVAGRVVKPGIEAPAEE